MQSDLEANYLLACITNNTNSSNASGAKVARGLSGGAVAGLVIGILAVVGIAFFAYYRHMQMKAAESDADNLEMNPMSMENGDKTQEELKLAA